MLIDLLTSRCRSTQVKLYTGLIASTNLWPQEMFTFSEMLALVQSESSFGAYVCHRRPAGLHSDQRSCFRNLERFTVHFKPGILISKLLIFIISKNLRTIRKLIAYENFQDYSSFTSFLFFFYFLQPYFSLLCLPSSFKRKLLNPLWGHCQEYKIEKKQSYKSVFIRKKKRFCLFADRSQRPLFSLMMHSSSLWRLRLL